MLASRTPHSVPLLWNETSTCGPFAPGSTRVPVIWPISSPSCSPSMMRTPMRSVWLRIRVRYPGRRRIMSGLLTWANLTIADVAVPGRAAARAAARARARTGRDWPAGCRTRILAVPEPGLLHDLGNDRLAGEETLEG